jgi:hypothetical protein
VKLSNSDPVILAQDGNYSHSRNTKVTDCVQENRAHIVLLPPHITHTLQSLKTYHAQEIVIWLEYQPNTVVTHCHITELVRKAYLKSATAAIAAATATYFMNMILE